MSELNSDSQLDEFEQIRDAREPAIRPKVKNTKMGNSTSRNSKEKALEKKTI